MVKAKDDLDKLLVLGPIYLEDNVFIGARATLLPGTRIGHNSIIGACAVVKGNIPPESIAVGNPGKVVGKVDEWMDKKFSLERNVVK